MAKQRKRATKDAILGRNASLEARLARALNHPLRARILAVLNDRPMASVELADHFDFNLSNVSYHVRVLHDLRLIERVGTVQVRGATKTTYAGTTRMLLDDEVWSQLSKETRTGITGAAVGEAFERAATALAAGTIDSKPDFAVINLKIDLDDLAWRKVAAIIKAAYEKISEIEVESTNRADPGDTERFTISLLAYESPKDGDGREK